MTKLSILFGKLNILFGNVIRRQSLHLY